MQIAVDENQKGRPLNTDNNGNLKVVVTEGGTGGTETTLNASIQTVGTTASTVTINKKVTTIDIANYGDTADVTLTIGTTSYVIGGGIATTLTINKDVTNISLVSTVADTKVQLVVKGVE